jgi:hypothetical protein
VRVAHDAARHHRRADPCILRTVRRGHLEFQRIEQHVV